MRPPPTPSSLFGAATNALTATIVFMVAFAHALSSEEPSADLFIVRSMRPSFGILHRVDVIVASIANLLPVNARVHGASVATATFVALFAYMVATELRRGLETMNGGTLWAGPVSMIGVLAGLLTTPWQFASSVPGGEAIAAILSFLPVILYARSGSSTLRDGVLGALLGFAAIEDPRMACVALVALAALRFTAREDDEARSLAARPLLLGALAGLLPLATRLAIGHANVHQLSEGFIPPDHLAPSASLLQLRASAGGFLLTLGAVGIAIGLRTASTRALTVGLATLAALGAISATMEGGAPPLVVGPGTLTFILATSLLATFSLFEVIRVITSLRLRFMKMTTGMIFLLEVAIVVQRAEVAREECDRQRPERQTGWHRLLFEDLPKNSAFVVSSKAAWLSLEAARLSGALEGGLLVPTFAKPDGVSEQELRTSEPLRALVRELELGAPPSEWALSSLADGRPVFLEWSPRWDRSLERHLTLNHLLPEYRPAPRGTAELERSLVEWNGGDAPLLQSVISSEREGGTSSPLSTGLVGRPPANSPLALVVQHLLHVRAAVLAIEGERGELQVLDAVSASIAPNDPWMAELRMRAAKTKGVGPIEIRGMRESD